MERLVVGVKWLQCNDGPKNLLLIGLAIVGESFDDGWLDEPPVSASTVDAGRPATAENLTAFVLGEFNAT